ncbi:hypothetical protein ACFFNX_39010, partial [Actinoallomurus acaciae]
DALAAVVRADGGLAAGTGTTSDLPTSIAAAPGVADHSWLGATGSPVQIGLNLGTGRTAVRASVAGGWFTWRVAAASVLAVVLAGAIVIGILAVRHRIARRSRAAPPSRTGRPTPPGQGLNNPTTSRESTT